MIKMPSSVAMYQVRKFGSIANIFEQSEIESLKQSFSDLFVFFIQ